MTDEDAQLLIEEVRQMRKLLELLAEPAIAQRDAKLRGELQKIVGSSVKMQQCVFLMDGSRTQKQIVTRSSVLSIPSGLLSPAGLKTISACQNRICTSPSIPLS